MSVITKNPYDLLGDEDGDSATSSGPVKTVDKTSTRTAKRNADEAPVRVTGAPTGAPAGSRRGGGYSGSEAAFRDRNAGHDRNRGKPTDDSPRGGGRGGHTARVRGGRGGRFPRERDDRHSKGLPSGSSEKQADKGWGYPEGEAELKDEQVGEEIAQTDQKEAVAEGEAADASATETKEEAAAEAAEAEADKRITLGDYLAQQAEKKLALEEGEKPIAVRKPNEGSKENKKWASAKPLVKDDDENYVAGTGGKAKRERERKTKQLVEIDNRYVEPERPRGGRGGRGGGPPRGDSTRGAGRGGPRGGRGGPGRFDGSRVDGGRGDGGRGDGQRLNTNDTSAFPSLGS